VSRRGRVRSIHRAEPSRLTIARLRRYGIPIGKDGRLYAAFKKWGADWKAGDLLSPKNQREILKRLDTARLAKDPELEQRTDTG
jgi:hypothetical protein